MIRILLVIMTALLLISCGVRRVGPRPPEQEPSQAGEVYDPLPTPEDRMVVPVVYPVQAAAVSDAGDSLAPPPDISYLAFDSVTSLTSPSEVYRVQIFTSRLYAEANRERLLAEEIFNLPIYLDYEVPYYKLRVGEFVTRDEAENMIPEIKAIGYRNAWVARVILRVKEAPEFGPEDEPLLPEGLSDSLLTPSDSADRTEGEDDY